MTDQRNTIRVTSEVFREVYDTPASLPGRYRWITPDEDLRELESLLGLRPGTIGAPLWVSGDRRHCGTCSREVNWLDIVSSALDRVHDRATIARVILGEEKFVNTEVPKGIGGLVCVRCKSPFDGIRSFKCHNWAYAKGRMLRIIAEMQQAT